MSIKFFTLYEKLSLSRNFSFPLRDFYRDGTGEIKNLRNKNTLNLDEKCQVSTRAKGHLKPGKCRVATSSAFCYLHACPTSYIFNNSFHVILVGYGDYLTKASTT